ncbi:SDR family oxidoreductase [Pseudomonas taiwanensis]|uniref:SDR family NAD(P)-dependent oxidoreductase n=1 Tax=Pseudomonas taiwanensis TaxID=470150 RepID=UPI0028DD8EB0|nr:SDR family oxidoreductase [Pseudomonas taiwanensis]MDT8924524.1 SDR family oxidoreductase [Pseudomonas taiwanensis]
MARLKDKVAIITGAGRGIGRATAKLFASEGAKVAVISRTSDNVAQVVSEITSSGGIAHGITCDVSDREQLELAVKTVFETFGAVDILVNNAFDPSQVFSSLLDLSPTQLLRNFEMGPISYLHAMQACHPYLKASEQGRIINLGSMAGIIGYAGMGPYNMAKEAVRALTRTAAREWGADGITVNNILPLAQTWDSTVDVPLPSNALNRFGSPEADIAPVLLFLASKDAQFLTGYSFTPDGGAIIDSAR